MRNGHGCGTKSLTQGFWRVIWSAVTELKVLITREQIAARVTAMAADITRDFSADSVIFVGVLKAAAIFLSDLSRQAKFDATFDSIAVSRHGSRLWPAEA